MLFIVATYYVIRQPDLPTTADNLECMSGAMGQNIVYVAKTMAADMMKNSYGMKKILIKFHSIDPSMIMFAYCDNDSI